MQFIDVTFSVNGHQVEATVLVSEGGRDDVVTDIHITPEPSLLDTFNYEAEAIYQAWGASC